MSDGDGAEVVVAGERLLVGTEWVVAGTVRVRRRIVTERRVVEVDVRREIVEIEGDTVDIRDGWLFGTATDGLPLDGPPAAAGPFVALLREEVPRVVLETRPYERLTVTTTRVANTVGVTVPVAHEEIEVTRIPSS